MRETDARSLSTTAQEALRQRAIRAVLGGMTHADAAQLLGVARGTVTRWMARYRAEGDGGLAAKVRGRRPAPKSQGEEAATLVRLICRGCPDQLGLPFELWTRAAVSRLIHEWLGLELSPWTVRRYLQRWGLIVPQPVHYGLEPDRQALSAWWQADYPAIRGRARRERGEIQWGSETALHLAQQVDSEAGRPSGGLGGARSDVRPPDRMISSVTGRGTWRFLVFAGPLTADLYVDFLRRLTRSTGKKVYLIVAPDPVYGAEPVARWLARHPDGIRMFTMPVSHP